MEPTNEALIDHAASVLNPKMVGNRLFGDVGCALITRDGNLYLLPRQEWSEPVVLSARGGDGPYRSESGGEDAMGKSRERRNRPRQDPVMVDHRQR